MKQPYIKIVNVDGLPYDSFFWAYLETFNRKPTEVINWTTTQITALPNTVDFGFRVPVAGLYTAFRKRKINGVTDFVNVEVLACDGIVDSQIIYSLATFAPSDGFNFRVGVELLQLGEYLLGNFEYGYALNATDVTANWQASNSFDLINEGVYFFDVRVKGQTTTVGKQSIELYINQGISNIGGGDESDNQTPAMGTSED